MTIEKNIEVLKDLWRYKETKYTEKEIRDSLEKGIESLKNQKTGHWIELGCVGNDNYDFECSECHHTDTQSKTMKVNYCWYCGAKMEGENR